MTMTTFNAVTTVAHRINTKNMTTQARRLVRLAAAWALMLAAVAGLSACAQLEWGARPAAQPLSVAPDVRFAQVNGLRLAYLEEGQGPLVLLFHGYPATARAWAGVQHRLAAAGYRVVAPYLRGYAPSASPPDGDYAAGSLGRDVVGWIDALGERSAVVMGHDWGALAAYAAAAMHPEKIRQLVAIGVPHPRGFETDPTIFWEAPHFVYYQLPGAQRLLWSHDFAHIERIYQQWSPGYQPSLEVMQDIKATLRAPGGTEGALGYYWALLGGSGMSRAQAQATIRVPTLIVAGAQDGAFGLHRYPPSRFMFSGPYTLVELEGVGHFPPLEAPDRTAEAIMAFLRGAP